MDILPLFLATMQINASHNTTEGKIKVKWTETSGMIFKSENPHCLGICF